MPFTINIALDFGTTYSGGAWGTTKKPKDIHKVTSWESAYNKCSDVAKCPTVLQIGDIDEKTPWGYNVASDKEDLRWFKLLLLDAKDVPRDVAQSFYYKEACFRQKVLGKTAVELVSCYLRSLWNFTLAEITRALGSGEVDNCYIHCVITVPAMWPHYALDRMRRAAEIAGIVQEKTVEAGIHSRGLHLVSEPEAAAMAVLAEFQPRPDIQEGDTIVVCDAGGGTVDVISYQVGSASSYQLRECVMGEGGLCGGIFVDERFEQLLRSKVGSDIWDSQPIDEKKTLMLEQWENGAKPQFDSGGVRSYTFHVCDKSSQQGATSLKNRITRITVELKSPELLVAFEPVVNDVIALIQRQIDAILAKSMPYPKFIILVGGFGCCKFLFQKLVETYPATTILNPPRAEAWTAICRGAVRYAIAHRLRGQSGTPSPSKRNPYASTFIVQSRVARESIGLVFHADFDAEKHDENDGYIDPYNGMKRAKNQIVWAVTKGQSLDSTSGRTYDFFRVFDVGSTPTIEEELHVCNLDEPPSRTTEDVQLLGVVEWKHQVDLSRLGVHHGENGEDYHVLRYKIRVTIESPVLRIVLLYKQKKVGEKEVRVKFEV